MEPLLVLDNKEQPLSGPQPERGQEKSKCLATKHLKTEYSPKVNGLGMTTNRRKLSLLLFDVVDNDDIKHFVKVCTKGHYKPISSRTVSRTGQFLVHSSEEIAKRLGGFTKDLNLGPNVRATMTCDGGVNMKKAGKGYVINDVFWRVEM